MDIVHFQMGNTIADLKKASKQEGTLYFVKQTGEFYFYNNNSFQKISNSNFLQKEKTGSVVFGDNGDNGPYVGVAMIGTTLVG